MRKWIWALMAASLALAQGPLGQGLVIADAGNHRLVELSGEGRLRRVVPLPPPFRYTDDVFFAPGGQVAYITDPEVDAVAAVRYPEGRLLWVFGQPGRPGRGPGQLDNPDDLIPLPSGLLAVADIRNCRVLLLTPAGKLSRTLGRTGVCRNADGYFNKPNGAFPFGKDKLLVTEIVGRDVAVVDLNGRRLKTIPLPTHYPSDANLTPWGTILVVDWWSPGAVYELDLEGRVLWRYRPRGAKDRLDHPSVAVGLPDGRVVLTDDRRHRLLVLDRKTGRVVFQYGKTDTPGEAPGLLRYPDGLDVIR
jgi:outer membrane protein assembly factor BamB